MERERIKQRADIKAGGDQRPLEGGGGGGERERERERGWRERE